MDHGTHHPDPEFRWLGRVDYAAALDLQQALAEARRRGDAPDTVLLLEHDPVYTIGRTRDRSSLRDAEARGLPVVETNRGGQATFHGPGQLVGYPILDLAGYGKDLHHYLRSLEDALVAACGAVGIAAGRREGLTGVWVGDRKIASIGVGVSRWISMHGFAINVAADLGGFGAITPCGIAGVEMTSVERETGRPMGVEAFAGVVQDALRQALARLRAR
jgi:lipoyl(octanoyl) transferase